MLIKAGEKIRFAGERNEWIFEKSDYDFDFGNPGNELTKWYYFRKTTGKKTQMRIELFDLMKRLKAGKINRC